MIDLQSFDAMDLKMLNRRDFFRRTVLAGGAVLGAPMINHGRFRLFAGTRVEYSRRAVDLVGESLVIDMLGLLTLDWRTLERWERTPDAFRPEDFRRLKSSGITVFNPAVDLDAPNAAEAFATTRQWLQGWNALLANHPLQLLRIERAEDLARAKSDGRIGIVLGLQNAVHFRMVEDVRLFHDLGQRISQLTYNEPNQVGAGCRSPRDTGLTEYGAAVIQAMNVAGMAIDVSHSSDSTTLDAIRASRKPVLITHANCRTLNPRQPRCKPDKIIRQMAACGGVMGITSIRRFVRGQEPTTLEDVLDHFDHVAKLVGVEHLGVGSDFGLGGRDRPGGRYRADIGGLNHPQRIYALTDGLIRRGYDNGSIRLILGENFRRALTEIWS